MLDAVDGRRLGFAVSVRHEGRLVGRGRMQRTVVDRAGFLERAERGTAG